MKGKHTKHVKAFVATRARAGEQVVDVLEGWVGEMFGTGDKQQQNGALILTNSRVVFYRKSLLGEVEKAIEFGQVTNVERSKVMTCRKVRLLTAGGEVHFKTMEAEQLFERVLLGIEAGRRGEALVAPQTGGARGAGSAVSTGASGLSSTEVDPKVAGIGCLALVWLAVAAALPLAGLLSGLALVGLAGAHVAGKVPAGLAGPIGLAGASRGGDIARSAALGTFGLLIVALGASALGQAAEEKKALAEQEAERATAVAQKAEEDQRLRAEAGTIIAALDADIAEIRAATTAMEFERAEQLGSAVLTKYDPYLTLNPKAPELVESMVALKGLAALVEGVGRARASADEAKQSFVTAETLRLAKDWMGADDLYTGALGILDGISGDYVKFTDSSGTRKDLERGQRRVAKRAAAARKKLVEEEAERAALALLCGPKPLQSGWDGSLPAVKDYLRESANDPDSIEVSDCTIPQLTKKYCWLSTCKVRGKNGFGAMILNQYRFSIARHPILESHGQVIGAEIL